MEKYIGIQGFTKTDVVMTDNPEEALNLFQAIIPDSGKDFSVLKISQGSSSVVSYEVQNNMVSIKFIGLN